MVWNKFKINNKDPKPWYGKTWVTRYELQVASYELLVTSWKLESTSWNSKVRVQIHQLRVQIHELRVQFYELRIKISELRVQIHESTKTQVNSLKIYSFPQILNLKSFGNLWSKSSVQSLEIISCFTFPLFYDYGFIRKQCE